MEEGEGGETSETKTRNLEAPAVLHITGTSGVFECARAPRARPERAAQKLQL